MVDHPPWLRFQAYVVGLPKTGSTSLATLFGRYRSGHEWDLQALVGAGIDRQRGRISDADFWGATGRRLDPPSLEMDSATSHYLYADLLAERFPTAVFIHSVRDVGGWVSSVLDMVLRKRLARLYLDIPYSTWESRYLSVITEGRYNLDPADPADDHASVAPLMRFWAEHMRRMPAMLPQGRSLVVRTRDIPARLDDLAALTGVPRDMLRDDLSHANRAPVSFDRVAAFRDTEIDEVYAEQCADIMAEQFPEEHAQWSQPRQSRPSADWDAYRAAVQEWVAEAVREHGTAAAH